MAVVIVYNGDMNYSWSEKEMSTLGLTCLVSSQLLPNSGSRGRGLWQWFFHKILLGRESLQLTKINVVTLKLRGGRERMEPENQESW